MEFISLFKDFGYPALMSGVLLWIVVTKIEKMTTKITELILTITVLTEKITKLEAEDHGK